MPPRRVHRVDGVEPRSPSLELAGRSRGRRRRAERGPAASVAEGAHVRLTARSPSSLRPRSKGRAFPVRSSASPRWSRLVVQVGPERAQAVDLEQLGRRQRRGDEDPRPGDGVVQAERIEDRDLQHPPDGFDGVQAGHVVGARQGLLLPRPQRPERKQRKRTEGAEAIVAIEVRIAPYRRRSTDRKRVSGPHNVLTAVNEVDRRRRDAMRRTAGEAHHALPASSARNAWTPQGTARVAPWEA